MLEEIFKVHSIPQVKGSLKVEFFGYNLEENAKLKIIYPVDIMISSFCMFDEQSDKSILLKILNIKCSPIEIEASVNIVLEIMNKISMKFYNFCRLFG